MDYIRLAEQAVPKGRSQKIGLGKGICGSNNSCYVDSTLFCLLFDTEVFDSLLLRVEESQDAEVKAVIGRLNVIAAALREPPYSCDANTIQDFRNCLSVYSPKIMDNMMDVEEFLHIFFDKALKAKRLINYFCGEIRSSNSIHQIMLDTSYNPKRKHVSNVQSLLNESMKHQNLEFASVPEPALIIKMPRSNGQLIHYHSIRPNPVLDITHLMANRKEDDGKVTMELSSVICISDKHYTAFVHCSKLNDGKNSWVYFDSMAYTGCPEVSIAPGFEQTLAWDDSGFFGGPHGSTHMHLSKNIHMCIYTRSRSQQIPQTNGEEQNASQCLLTRIQNMETDSNFEPRNAVEQEKRKDNDPPAVIQVESSQLQAPVVDESSKPAQENWIVRFLKAYVFTGGTGQYTLWPRAEERTYEPELMNKITVYGQGIEEKESGSSLNSVLFALFYDSDVLLRTISSGPPTLEGLALFQKAYPVFTSLHNKLYVNWEESQPLRSYLENHFPCENPPAFDVIVFLLKEICNLDLFGIVPNDYFLKASESPEKLYPPLPPPYRLPFENVLKCFFDFDYAVFERLEFPLLILSTQVYKPFMPFPSLLIDMENITRGKMPGQLELFAVICFEYAEYSTYVRRIDRSKDVPSKTWWYYESDFHHFHPTSAAKVSELPTLEKRIEEIECKMRKGSSGSVGTLGPWDQIVTSLPVGHCKTILENSVVTIYAK